MCLLHVTTVWHMIWSVTEWLSIYGVLIYKKEIEIGMQEESIVIH